MPDERVYQGFQGEIIQQILDEQKRKYEKYKNGTAATDDIPYVVIVLEDIISEKTIRYEDLLHELCFMGRHYFVFVIVCSQG